MAWQDFTQPPPYSTPSVVLDSIGGRNGVLKGAVFADGPIGSAMFFDGINDSVDIADSGDVFAFGGNAPFTIEFLVRLDSPFAANDRVISKQYSTQSWTILLNSLGGITMFRLLNGVSDTVTAQLVVGVLARISTSYDGVTLKMYKDGILVDSIPSSRSMLTNGVPLLIGNLTSAGGSPNRPFHGLIDDLRIWNFARADADILADKGKQLVSPPGLIGNWRFDLGWRDIV
jgi:hypothetical protein